MNMNQPFRFQCIVPGKKLVDGPSEKMAIGIILSSAPSPLIK